MSESTHDHAAALPDSHSWWRDLRDAARGTRHDYTSGNIGRAIFLLAVPMVLEMLMKSLFAVSDVFWVARRGADAIATVGLTESLMIIVYTLAVGLSIAATATVARRVGEKDPDAAARAGVQDFSSSSSTPRSAAPATRRWRCACCSSCSRRSSCTRSPRSATWINLGVFWLFEIPFAWWLSTRGSVGYRSVFVAVLAAYSVMAAVSTVLFKRGRWRTHTV